MYDQPVPTATVIGSLESSGNPALDTTVISQIISLSTNTTAGGTTDNTVTVSQVTLDASGNATVPAGTEVALITLPAPATPGTPVVVPAAAVKNVPVLIFQGTTDVDVSLNDGATAGGPGAAVHQGATTPATGAQRVVVMGAGNSKVTIGDAKNTTLTLGTGNSTVVTGHGVDTVVAGLGNSTITGGNSDYSVVKLAAAASNYTVTTTTGHAIVTDNITHKVTDISKIQYVETAGSDALILASSNTEASIATMFQVAFGRTVDAAGLNYYYDMAKAGATEKQIADALVKSGEFLPHTLLDDQSFVNSLYQNTFGRNGETAGINYWLNATMFTFPVFRRTKIGPRPLSHRSAAWHTGGNACAARARSPRASARGRATARAGARRARPC
jgi:hypothetical protein